MAEERLIQADQELLSTAQQLEYARDQAKQWGGIADGLRKQILEKMGEDDALIAVNASGLPVVKITESARRNFDKERFALEHPDIDLRDYDSITLVRSVTTDNV